MVVLDPGHGGAPNNNDPSQPYDSGAVTAAGLLEKDLALDVARRAATLLAADDAVVVLTRSDDRYLDIPTRTQVAVEDHADVFTSIHMNGFADGGAGGSVVLYPNEDDHPFAGQMAAALDRALSPYGVTTRGTTLRDNWWIHVPCPVVTIEPLFLTNATEAALVARDEVRQAIAAAVRDGIEAQIPDIAARRPLLEAYRAAHGGALPAVPLSAGAASPAAVPAKGDGHADPSQPPGAGPAASAVGSFAPANPAGGPRLPLVAWPLFALLAAIAWLWRRRLLPLSARGCALLLRLVSRLDGREPPEMVRYPRPRARPTRAATVRRGPLAAPVRSATVVGTVRRGATGTIYGTMWDQPERRQRVATSTAATRPMATTAARRTTSGSRRARPAPR